MSKHYSFLGASPDGVVESSKSSEQILLEVKCPYKWRNMTVSEACSNNDFYCFFDDNNELQLKKSSRYYTQVQGQMGDRGYKKCDFVIYTAKDLKIISISFDDLFWVSLLQKLVFFYKDHVIPRLCN